MPLPSGRSCLSTLYNKKLTIENSGIPHRRNVAPGKQRSVSSQDTESRGNDRAKGGEDSFTSLQRLMQQNRNQACPRLWLNQLPRASRIEHVWSHHDYLLLILFFTLHNRTHAICIEKHLGITGRCSATGGLSTCSCSVACATNNTYNNRIWWNWWGNRIVPAYVC